MATNLPSPDPAAPAPSLKGKSRFNRVRMRVRVWGKFEFLVWGRVRGMLTPAPAF